MLSKHKLLIVFCLGLFAGLPALAEEVMLSQEVDPELTDDSPFSANVSLVNNYLYRGISQTGGKPAIQGGVDYVHASHFYAGVWGSSISWLGDQFVDTQNLPAGQKAGATSAGLELDAYFGYKNKLGKDFTYDLGFLRYNFPGSYAVGATRADTNEVYASANYKWLTAKYSYSLGNAFGNAQTSGTNYFELLANYHVEPLGVVLGAHYGKQTFKGAGAILNGNSLTYNDYKLSITKQLEEEFELSLAYSKTDATAAYTVLGKNLGKGAVIASITRVF
jgi:uncharacterized protein (TIGR02001 family)